MHVASPASWSRSPADLTARARLRDAAIESFAINGLEASLRDISARAGVSVGLIRHHFGGKDALRAACDDEVLRRVREIKSAGLAMSPIEALGLMAQIDGFASTFVYILRSVRAGGAVGSRFVEQMIADALAYTEQGVAAGVLKPSHDPAARARYLVTSRLGGMLVQLSLMPELDLADVGPTIRRLSDADALPALELFTEGLLVDRAMLDGYLASAPDPPEHLNANSHVHQH